MQQSLSAILHKSRSILFTFLLLCAFSSKSAVIEGSLNSIGIGFSGYTAYTDTNLKNSGFPNYFYIQGSDNFFRFEYLKFNSFYSDIQNQEDSRYYTNEMILGYLNFEYLMRAKKGSLLGRTKVYFSGGLGMARSKLFTKTSVRSNNTTQNIYYNTDVQHSNNDYNVGFSLVAGLRYFFDTRFFMGGEYKYINVTINFDTLGRVKNQDIGGSFFNVIVGYRLTETSAATNSTF